MEVFKGWYRKSLARKNMVWHRVNKVDSILTERQMATTLCGKRIPTTKCDFHMKPDKMCLRCEKNSTPTGSGFAPIGSMSIQTKADAIHHLKRLLKQRTYYLRIWDDQGIKIKARWESDVSIDIYTEDDIITKQRKNNVIGLAQIQADLGRFKSAIDCLCDGIDKLALEEKRKKKLKGRLTEPESQTYFEKLLHEAEK